VAGGPAPPLPPPLPSLPLPFPPPSRLPIPPPPQEEQEAWLEQQAWLDEQEKQEDAWREAQEEHDEWVEHKKSEEREAWLEHEAWMDEQEDREEAWREAQGAEAAVTLLLLLVTELPEVFAAEVLTRLNPINRAFLAQVGGACRAAVAASDLPRAGTRGEVFGRSVWVVTPHTCMYAAAGGHLQVLQLAREHRCRWDATTPAAPLVAVTWRWCSGGGRTAARGTRRRCAGPLRASTTRCSFGRCTTAVGDTKYTTMIVTGLVRSSAVTLSSAVCTSCLSRSPCPWDSTVIVLPSPIRMKSLIRRTWRRDSNIGRACAR
jgi:hypothetical protein